MGKRQKNKLVNNTTPVNAQKVKSTFVPEGDSSPKFYFANSEWLSGAKVKGGVTTYLKDSSQYGEKVSVVFTALIPTLLKEWRSIYVERTGRYKHCHKLDGIALTRATELIQEIYGKKAPIDKTSEFYNNIWQFGFTHGIRIVCGVSTSNVIFPFFADYHHLVSPDEKYNAEDYDSYRFCPRRQTEVSDEFIEESAITSIHSIPDDELLSLYDSVCEPCKEKVGPLIFRE
ncbi:hypothetical protein ACFQO8_03655 [Exiguobacterium aestuarii]|uniref:Uncharacterized protein n=1 Tax=Exiguobacterium aestuarii TaxID=273527 RepID=A0ABW2PLL0_9BACL|nr:MULTISPECIES: hypothetical protein [Exiguobacterium]MCT4785707.1 hypothetical protein [Exiguobacterium aestuarii]